MPKLPLVIAHRGASGYLPEHTLAAKALAHAQGADYLEQDVVASRDRRLIVCHDIFLDRVTDVAALYPQRARHDGRHYVIDFDWAEIRELTVTMPVGSLDHELTDDAEHPRESRICTLDEELQFIAELNRKGRRDAGVYPEIKQPRWHAEHGFDLSRAVVETLAAHGYDQPDGSAYLQCFDAAELRRIKVELGCPLPLVQLVGRSVAPRMLSDTGLACVAEYAAALGPNYRLLLRTAGPSGAAPTAVTERARSAGLQLHPYTFNRDELPAYAADLEQLLRTAYELLQPDAVFCDYPDVAVRVRDARHAAY